MGKCSRVTIDKNLNFNEHLSNICKKATQKVSALARVAKLMPFHSKRTQLKELIDTMDVLQ